MKLERILLVILLFLNLTVLLTLIFKMRKVEGYLSMDFLNGYMNDLKFIYNKVNANEESVVTGSGALVLILKELGRMDKLKIISEPNDLDLVYQGKGANYFSPNNVGGIYFRSQTTPGRSLTYSLRQPVANIKIKSFDITQIPKLPEYFETTDGIKVLKPDSLLKEYIINQDTEFNQEKIKQNQNKMDILREIISELEGSFLASKFLKSSSSSSSSRRRFFEEDEEDETPKSRERGGLFDDLDDQDVDETPIKKRKRNLFDDDDFPPVSKGTKPSFLDFSDL
jgi:hypothetical protein